MFCEPSGTADKEFYWWCETPLEREKYLVELYLICWFGPPAQRGFLMWLLGKMSGL